MATFVGGVNLYGLELADKRESRLARRARLLVCSSARLLVFVFYDALRCSTRAINAASVRSAPMQCSLQS